jgi:hypothetical protein
VVPRSPSNHPDPLSLEPLSGFNLRAENRPCAQAHSGADKAGRQSLYFWGAVLVAGAAAGGGVVVAGGSGINARVNPLVRGE